MICYKKRENKKNMNSLKDNILVAISGGVDSSVSTLLLKKEYEVRTLSFSIFDEQEERAKIFKDRIRQLAEILEVPNIFIDIHTDFKKEVICPFIDAYMSGNTPNPCVVCNRKIKFKLLYDEAKKISPKCKIATGHYAQVSYKDDRYFIKKHQDKNKDQSYMLWMLPQEYLAKTIFPLSEIKSKQETKNIAEDNNILEYINAEESQDICFIPDNNYREYIKNSFEVEKIEEGDILFNWKVVGKHKGLPFYTIGQRDGLGIALGFPVYVKDIDVKKNEIIVCEEKDLYKDRMRITNINLQKYEKLQEGYECTVKIRYHDPGHKAKVKEITDNTIEIEFEEPTKAITRGQSAVMYEGDDVVGGGVIM